MQEVFNFSAGPATLPKPILENIQQEFLNYNNTGLSVVELSHRSKEFFAIRNSAESLLRELIGISDDYAVLFMHGGASSQFSMLPLNFLSKGQSADYVCTGYWSTKAYAEAKKFADINAINALENGDSYSIRPTVAWELSSNASYVHYCDNETINGIAFAELPDVKSKPLACDMTSSILMRQIDVSRYGLIYAGAQKNLGIAGLCIVIVKKELLNKVNKSIPRLYDYKRCAEESSLVNTPPTFAIYVLRLLLDWVKSEGGVDQMYRRSKENSEWVYQVLDNSQLYNNKVVKEFRSNINISFDIQDKDLQNKFLDQAESHKLLGLRGHNSVGGVRISLYNAMPQAGVQRLVEFMQDFEICNVV